ncbi:MAG: ThuA domain-containing protein [Bryobacterales bacterium]
MYARSLLFLFFSCLPLCAADWVTYTGGQGPGAGKHIVFLTGDEEYRSEEGMPMMARMLARRHGFKTTVLFAIDPKTGEINPEVNDNIPGMEALDSADLLVLFVRWRELPDEQMRHFVDYFLAGKPIIALRTATHSFRYAKNPKSPFADYSYDSAKWPGGFGQQVLGETWVRHHGKHKFEGTRALTDGLNSRHPILRGVHDIFVPTDVYSVVHLPADATVLLHGTVTQSLEPDSPPNLEKSLMPVAWARHYLNEAGRTNRIFTTTMGASVDLLNEDLRRLVVNACYWGLRMDVPERANVDIVGDYAPIFFGFGDFEKGVKPSRYAP